MLFRRAEARDLDAVTAIYNRIHEGERLGRTTIGWIQGVYPVRATAEGALSRGELFVGEEDGTVFGSAILNHTQVDVYAQGSWAVTCSDDKVLVMHTLTIDPDRSRSGLGKAFLAFYEQYARSLGCADLRIDTNATNSIARRLYAGLGYHEVGMAPCTFNGIPGINLMLLEKPLV